MPDRPLCPGCQRVLNAVGLMYLDAPGPQCVAALWACRECAGPLVPTYHDVSQPDRPRLTTMRYRP